MSIKQGYCQTDTDGLVYKTEDTFWAIPPGGDDNHDPGVLDAKAGAIPVPKEEYWEND